MSDQAPKRRAYSDSIERPEARYDPTPDLIAASLAGGMIAAGGVKLTAEEAVGVWREVRAALVSPT